MTLDIKILACSALLSGCTAYCHEQTQDNAGQNFETATPKHTNIPSVTVSFDYATKTGLELETTYQSQITAQPTARHIITIGEYHYPFFMGDVGGAVQTLKQSLQGTVEIWRYPKDFDSGEALLEKIAQDTGASIASVHSFGHGDRYSYWLFGAENENRSLTIEEIHNINAEEKQQIHERFESTGYWKFYSCHAAAATEDYLTEENLARTIAVEFQILTIGANSWVYITEKEDQPRMMYPVSRAYYNKYNQRKNKSSEEFVDELYTGESAWIMYAPI